MDFAISNRMARLKPSIIRELLKQTGDPGLISFAGGNPAPDSFPAAQMAEISDRLLREDPVGMLQYSVSEGVPAVREAVRGFACRKYALARAQDELILTSGSQQVLDMAAKVLCNEGDVVAVEDPAFLSAYLSFRSYGARLVGVPMQEDGVDLDALEAVFAASPRPKFFYCIPNFQNPTGRTMSLAKRRAVYALSQQYGVVVLEDDPYGELRFAGQELPPIKSLGDADNIIYAGSFSKILSPGMRLAYCICDARLMRHMVVAKQSADVHTAVWSQRVCGEMLRTVDMDAHLARLRDIYGRKARHMMARLDADCPQMDYVRPQGGMFIWGALPAGVDMQDFVARCLARKVALVPGNAFQVDEAQPCQNVRLNFSAPSEEKITAGVALMGEVLQEVLK